MLVSSFRPPLATVTAVAFSAALLLSAPAQAQDVGGWLRDGLDAISKSQTGKTGQLGPADGNTDPAPSDNAPTAKPADPREGDPSFDQARRLMQAVEAILKDAASNRAHANKLPSRDEYLLTPLWTETREDRQRKIRSLLDAALGIVTDVQIVDVQKTIENRRRNIRDLKDRIAEFKARQLHAPKDALLPGVLNDTVDSLEQAIKDANKRIEANNKDIADAKSKVRAALADSGIKLTDAQMDLLLDGVLSGDMVRLVAVFNSAKLVDSQLAKLMSAAGENMNAARKYFAMHAALFAMLVHAQDTLIEKIDTAYLPKLSVITKDIEAAAAKTERLLRAENRPDQRRVLEANRKSQRISERAAKAYRSYLLQQREQVAEARKRAAHDLRIADNTFETVEASFQLHGLMRDSAVSFEALQKLEAPTFEQIFRNEELRREFENLTKRLEIPGS